jgi:proteasome lid subunit RPN8/RPN11
VREVCFLIGRGDVVVWADASDSPTALPDSRTRWEAIWHHRDELVAIAHSHPRGPAAFSAEDETTMEAIDSALGRVMRYIVVAPRVAIDRNGPILPEPWWAALLRLASGMRRRE